MREIKFFTIKKNQIFHLNYHMAAALGISQGKHDGLRIGGCGMDMGFHAVYNLGRTLYGNRKIKGRIGSQTDSGYAFRSEHI